jgi:putative sterol carrier protein
MWTEEYQADIIRGYLAIAAKKPFVVGMQVWNFADFAAVQSITRVGGMNMKGVFTRSRQPKMAAHVVREIWSKCTSEDTPENTNDVGLEPESPTEYTITSCEIQSILESLAHKIQQTMTEVTKTLKFDFYSDGIYRMMIDKGSCTVEPSDGLSDATIQLTAQDFKKLLEGKLNPMVATMSGRIKTEGDARAFMILLEG